MAIASGGTGATNRIGVPQTIALSVQLGSCYCPNTCFLRIVDAGRDQHLT
ncbi:hypothetical protein [Cylindrospermum stagnale]|nr:hypothetical protein [Cylindrospermum stagnale]